MMIKLWGTRGSVAASGRDTIGYGGNTSSVELRGKEGVLILDAGTGIRKLGLELDKKVKRVDILLTHMHVDHIQGLGFFTPLYDPTMEIHMYGPAKSDADLYKQIARYLSPPLFPVFINDLCCKLYFHAVPYTEFKIGEFNIIANSVCHPGNTVGYQIKTHAGKIAYIPDHEPALGVTEFPMAAEWTSGYDLALDADLLIHDAQYTEEEYAMHVGWGHSTIKQALLFALLTKVKKIVTFHHDPSHSDRDLDAILASGIASVPIGSLQVECGREGSLFKL